MMNVQTTGNKAKFGILLLIALLVVAIASDASDYGVDVTSPIHHFLSAKTNPFFHDRYTTLMQGCYRMYSRSECDATERERLRMSLDQPKTQHNYTELGFKKMRTPQAAWDLITNFFNSNRDKEKVEQWGRGYTYVNDWDAPSDMISFEDRDIKNAQVVKQKIWDTVRPVIEEWVGRKIYQVSLYGVRLYKNGSVLATR